MVEVVAPTKHEVTSRIWSGVGDRINARFADHRSVRATPTITPHNFASGDAAEDTDALTDALSFPPLCTAARDEMVPQLPEQPTVR